MVEWVRAPQQRAVRLPVPDGRGEPIVVPESAAAQRRGRRPRARNARAAVHLHDTPDGGRARPRAHGVPRQSPRRRSIASMPMSATSFRRGSNLFAEQGFRPRRDLSGYRAEDCDLRIADLHYRDMCEWAVGRNAAAAGTPTRTAAGSHAGMDRSAPTGRSRARRAERGRRVSNRGSRSAWKLWRSSPERATARTSSGSRRPADCSTATGSRLSAARSTNLTATARDS